MLVFYLYFEERVCASWLQWVDWSGFVLPSHRFTQQNVFGGCGFFLVIGRADVPIVVLTFLSLRTLHEQTEVAGNCLN